MGKLTQEEINVDLFDEVKRLKSELRISQQKIDQLEETIRIYKISDEIVKEQSKKIKHLFPLENIVGYGQLCDKVL
ncbi:hypothetical protein MXL46_13775 [Heyndrickxia sporothermodurans]|uniref:hypothetical protein n=1 Tax=Heyndrickxia sporothermodurans TaxID=46224 RepID=UPI002DBA6741|nr:hypothetical protein [Heyndrickxia sporothermodurans]MEB6550159.1 hypothetical protein [Heyndrickxia sporothermodurans]